MNDLGQLGLGSNARFITFASPVLSLQGTKIEAITADSDHTLALDWQGNVWAWGDNHQAELGIGSHHVKSSVPVSLDLPRRSKMGITRIAAGALHS